MACIARATSCGEIAESAQNLISGDAATARANASSNCVSYWESVPPASVVLAHIRSAASVPRTPTKRPAH